RACHLVDVAVVLLVALREPVFRGAVDVKTHGAVWADHGASLHLYFLSVQVFVLLDSAVEHLIYPFWHHFCPAWYRRFCSSRSRSWIPAWLLALMMIP